MDAVVVMLGVDDSMMNRNEMRVDDGTEEEGGNFRRNSVCVSGVMVIQMMRGIGMGARDAVIRGNQWVEVDV